MLGPSKVCGVLSVICHGGTSRVAVKDQLFAMVGPRKVCGVLPVICHGGTSPSAVDCTQLFAMGRDLADAVK